MSTAALPRIAGGLRVGLRMAALAVLLGSSALLTAAAWRAPDCSWPAWVSFLPLFVVIRSLGPVRAAMAGGSWGGCLYFFCTAGRDRALGPSAVALALLVGIPAVYVSMAALFRRAFAFRLLTLAMGWALVEGVLHLCDCVGAHDGLLTRSAVAGPQFHWPVRVLAYVCAALLVACANASLVELLSGARLGLPPGRFWTGRPNAGSPTSSPGALPIQVWLDWQERPRAPPLQGGGPASSRVGGGPPVFGRRRVLVVRRQSAAPVNW